MAVSEVQNFYKGSKIFITGATGFVGKSIIEKLLRVTEVDTIYVLMREKRGKTIAERLKKIFEDPLFQKISSINENFRGKIKAIRGECGLEGLGISESDRSDLRQNVHIIFHIAATVNFNENLKRAFDINFGGTQELLQLAKEITHLKSFVYVSTAFSNCLRSHIEEKVYEFEFESVVRELEDISVESAEKMRKTELLNFNLRKDGNAAYNVMHCGFKTNAHMIGPFDYIIPLAFRILGDWPNTYTFTKNLAENLVNNNREFLPIGIFRPSVIISSYKEPIPGWTDNIYAVNGISLGILTGFLRVFFADEKNIMEAIPIDMATSALLACSWEIAKRAANRRNKTDILVYNYTSGPENPIEFKTMFHINCNKLTPTLKCFWNPCGLYIKNEILGLILSFFLEIVPGMFMDLIMLIAMQKPRFVALYLKAIRFGWIMRFFGQKRMTFDNSNVQKLWGHLSEKDRELFCFGIKTLNWLEFSETYSWGLRKYILKEDDSTIDLARRRLYWLKMLHNAVKIVSNYILVWLLLVMIKWTYSFIIE